MIIVPAWVEKDEPDGIMAVLGSEPKPDAVSEWIPRKCISKCIYSDLTNEITSKRMAMLLMPEENLPEQIKRILENNK